MGKEGEGKRGKRQQKSTAMCMRTEEALGYNLNRRRLLLRQEMRARLVPGMGLNWMIQTQTSIRNGKGNSKVIESSISFLII